MQVVLLAAGVGKRLGATTQTLPKCLLEVHGQTLLERHLRTFLQTGIDEAIVVTGHCSEQIHAAADRLALALPIPWVWNPRFPQGSILSLAEGLKTVHQDVIIMDADVYYGPPLFERLMRSAHANCVLIDPSASETGEEMMIGVRDARAVTIARSLKTTGPYDLQGESVGFFKVSAQDVATLRQVIEQTVVELGGDVEYESAIDRFFKVANVGFESTDGLAWTEIDFEQDLVRARDVIAPLLRESIA